MEKTEKERQNRKHKLHFCIIYWNDRQFSLLTCRKRGGKIY